MEARIAEVVHIPKRGVNVASVRKELTVKVFDHQTQTSSTVEPFYTDGDYLCVPRHYGLSLIKSHRMDVVDDTSIGFELSEGIPRIQLHEYQEPWVESIMSMFLDEDRYDVMAQAGTGKGKTVMSLEIARRLGSTTVVLVDQEFLRDQWIARAKEFWGLDDSQIGIVQGSTCDFEGKDLVVGMVQSLYRKDYDEELYQYFGTIIFDEAHTVGAEQFSAVLSKFNATFRLGVSATPDRTDDLQKVLEQQLGPVAVTLKNKHRKSTVRYVEYDGVVSWYANVSPKGGRFLTELARDTRRNYLLANIIHELYETDRHVLVVSDRIEQLETLMVMCKSIFEIPAEDMGLVSGYRSVWKYAKDATPPRKPEHLHKDAEYTPVKIQVVRKRIPKAVLKKAKDDSRIVFATGGMFTKGVDVPRLSAGVDCSPRSKAVQVHGRILREYKGKKVPVWVTLRDIMSYKAEYQFLKRLSEYKASNAEIEQWDLVKGTRRVDLQTLKASVTKRHKKLKSLKIITGLDGNNTVMIPTTGRQQRSAAAPVTGKGTQRRSARQR